MGSLKITIRSSATEERTVEVPLPSSRPLGGNTEVREFLALRARERRAAARARRIKRTCLALGAATAVAVFVVPKWRARWSTAAAITTVTTPEFPALPAVEPGPQGQPAATFDEPVSLAAVAPSALVATGRAVATLPADEMAPMATGNCQDDFEQRRWRAAVETCTQAFETAPQAGLALKVAHAHWARGDVGLSGEWAGKAVELGTADADAYVLIGHAQRRAGNSDEAVIAYRYYLRASPRGWHARTVRAALRRLRPAPAEQPEQATAESEPAAQSLLQ
jgi:tetratricopeptide (TPR) repeat protein